MSFAFYCEFRTLAVWNGLPCIFEPHQVTRFCEHHFDVKVLGSVEDVSLLSQAAKACADKGLWRCPLHSLNFLRYDMATIERCKVC